MKCVPKKKITQEKLENHLIQEKNVLKEIDFVFIVKLIRTFKDRINIYFLEEYIKGIELFDAIRDIGILNVKESQFYIGSLILCVEYMHSRKIIYRDIKPENLMVDNQVKFIK